MAAANRAELEAFEAALQQFRVNELHILLSSFKCPKLGKKNELVQRCINLLQNSRNQAAVIQKIREISSSRRYNSLGAPSTPPMYNQLDPNCTVNGSVYSNMMTLSSALMQQQYISAHHPFASQMDRARSLRIVDLPFYDKQQTVLELSELPGNISGIRSTSRSPFTFSIPSNVAQQILYRTDTTVLPRTELQLRFFLLDHSAEQQDDFPPNCSVKIDDVPVTLPNIIPTNKPNAEPKRPSRPVNITPYCQPPRDAMRPHRMMIEWTADKRSWAVGIYVVTRITSEMLLQRLLTNVNARRAAEDTKRVVRSRLSGDDDAIQMETLKISLLCPLGKTRMIIPVKPYHCTHLQCFDLSNYLMMNEKRPTWKCAVCDNGAPYKKLVIDGYFEQMLKETDAETTEVELLHDGSWRPVVEEAETLSDDEEEIESSNDSKSQSQSAKSSAQSNNNHSTSNADDDIIVLDSDDDDELMLPRRPQMRSRMYRPMGRATTPPSVVCIDLDESDPVDLSPQACNQASGGPSVPSSSSNSVAIGTSPSFESTGIGTVGGLPQVSSSQPMMHPQQLLHRQQQQHQQQQQQHPHSTTQSMAYFPNPAMPLVPPPPDAAVMPGTSSSANFFNPFEQTPYHHYSPPDLNTSLIAEQLRQFMANIQQSTNTPNYPRYS